MQIKSLQKSVFNAIIIIKRLTYSLYLLLKVDCLSFMGYQPL